MPLLTAARVVAGDSVLDSGWLQVEGSHIVAVGSGAPPEMYGPAHDLGDLTLLPGFVDQHCHGGGGHWMTTGEPADVAAAADFHLRNGTTSILAGMITAGEADLARGVAAATELAGDPSSPIEGVLLEGPWISTVRCGAHDVGLIRPPDRAEWARVRTDAVRMVTLAPELAGASELAAAIRDAGAIVALGHSDASYGEALDAFAAGATVATHVFNAMPQLHHREPGLVGASIEAALCEVIADGHHVHPALIRLLFAAAPGRVALITDAIAFAGLPDGDHVVPGREARLDVRDGAARLGGTLAGSTLTMGQAVAKALAAGVGLAEASHAASTAPAAALGLTDRGVITPGRRADLVAIDRVGAVRFVWRAGLPIGLG